MADITKLPILTSATDGTYLLAVDNNVAKRLPFPGAGQLRGNQGYTGSLGYIGSKGTDSTVPGFVGSKGYTGSTGYTGSRGAFDAIGFTGSRGFQGPHGPNDLLNASALPDSTPSASATEYIVGVSRVGSTSTPIVSHTNPIVFNTILGSLSVGTTATHGTLNLNGTQSSIYFGVNTTATLHQLWSSPNGDLTLDIDTADAASGANFYLSQVGAHKLTMAPNGNIGVLTDVPAEALDVAGKLRISSSNIISKSYSRLYALDDSRLYWENQRYAATVSSPTNVLYAGTRIVGDIDTAETGGVFSFDNAPVAQAGAGSWAQRLTIIENGYVGINTPRPGALLTVSKNLTSTVFVPPGDQANTTLYLVGANSAYNRFWMESFGSGGNAVNVKVSGGTAQSPSATPAGYIWFVSAAGRGTTTNLGVGQARLGIGAEATFTDTSAPTYIFFQTTGGAERLRIDSVGRVQTAGATDGTADINIRNTATGSASGSLSLTASPAGGSGTSYILMGNSDGAGATGPMIVASSNRVIQLGAGTNFTSRTGGTFTPGLTLDANGNINVTGSFALSGVLTVSGISTMNTTFNFVDTTATTVNFAGAATQINMGNATAATILTRPGTIVGANTTQNLYNSVATTVNAFGAATAVNVAANAAGATTLVLGNSSNNNILTINGSSSSTINGSSGATTANVFNTNATTGNLFGAATAISIGAATGTLTVGNPTLTMTNGSAFNMNGNNPSIVTNNTGAASVFNTNVLAGNLFGAATSISIGAGSGATTVNNQLKVSGGLSASASTTTVNVQSLQVTAGGIGITGDSKFNDSLAVGNNLWARSNLDVHGGNITSDQTTFNIINTNATTVNAFGASTALNLGATSGTATMGNPTVVGTQATQYLWNTVANTVYFANAATALTIGATVSGTLTVNPGTVVGYNSTQNLFNTVATTMNFAGAATSLNMGSQADGSVATIANPSVEGARYTQYLWNTVPTTVNAFGAATAITIGAASGTTTINNMLRLIYSGSSDSVLQIVGSDTKGGAGYQDFLHVQNTSGGVTNPNKFFRVDNVGSLQIVNSAYTNTLLQLKDNGDLNIHGSNITSDQTTVNLINTNATTVNAFGAATELNLGANLSGTTTVRNDLTIQGNLTIQGGTTYSESTNTVISDNLIELHSMPTGVGTPWAVDDSKDIGIRMHYYNSGDQNAALVLAHDSRALEWYITGADTGPNFTGGVYGTFKTGVVKLVSGTANSGDASSGDLQVSGGAGIGGGLYVGGAISAGGGVRISGAFTATNIVDSALTSNRVTYAGTNGLLQDSSNLTFDGTYLTANSIKDSALTNGRVTYAGAGGLLQDSSNLTFDGTTLTAVNTITGKISDLSNHTTTDLSEGTRLYYTDSRARGAISVSGSLSYDSGTGVISYTTPTYSVSSFSNDAHYITSSSLSVATASASGSGSLSYNNGNGVFTFTPPSLPTNNTAFTNGANYITLGAISVTTATSTGSGALSYNSSTGVFTFTPPAPPQASSSVTVSATSPATPNLGDMWYDEVTGRLYVYWNGNWVDASPTPPGIGVLGNGIGSAGYSWHDVTSNRSIGTTYTNTASYAISVSVVGNLQGISQSQIYLQVNGVQVDGMQQNTAGANSGITTTMSAIVPPGSTYKVVTVAGSIISWAEMYPDNPSYTGSTGGGATANGCIYENGQTISTNYTMTAGNNGMSAGPITVATGVTVTIPTGSRWVIV